MFFDIFKKNSKIVLNFKKKVADSSQAYELFQVFKRFSNLIIENETITETFELNHQEKIEEIARMISDDNISDEARNAALKLLT